MSALSTLASARSAGRTRSSESNATHSYGTYAREVLQVRPPAVLVLQEVSDVDFQRDRAVPGSRTPGSGEINMLPETLRKLWSYLLIPLVVVYLVAMRRQLRDLWSQGWLN